MTTTLTSITVAKTPSPARDEPQRVVWDSGSGLGLRINHDSRSWIVQARAPDGRSVRRTLGSADGPNAIPLTQARKMARAAKVAIESGDAPEALRKRDRREHGPTGALTFSKAREQYIAAIKDVHAASYLKSWQSVATLLNRDEFADWEQRPLASITRADVKALFLAMTANIAARAEGKAPPPSGTRRGVGVSSNRALSAISSLWEWAAQQHGIEEANPARNWSSLRRAERGRESRIALADAGRIWRALDAAPSPWGTVYKLVFLLGCRRGEIQSLTRDQIKDLDVPGQARIEKGHTTKNSKVNRTIPLPEAARVLLLNAEARMPYVWAWDRPLADDWRIDQIIRNAAGLSVPWSVHAWRHLAADYLASIDTPLDTIRNVLGQAVPGVLAKYLSARGLADHRAALEAWETFITEQAAKVG